jgi:hypothetical protein
MERHYTTIEDVIAYEVEPALGDFVTQHDVEAIARECWILTDDGIYLQNPQYDFWEVAQRHDLTQNWKPDSVDVYTTKDHGGATLIRETSNESIVKCHGIRVGHAHLAFKVRCESGYLLDMVAEAERKLRKLEEKWLPVNCDEPITIEII